MQVRRPRRLPVVVESASTLRRLIASSTCATQVNKLQVLLAILQGKALNYTMLAEQFPVGHRTIGRWLKAYESGGLQEMLSEARGRARSSELANARDEAGISLLDAISTRLNDTVNSARSYKELHQEMQLRFGFKSNYTLFYLFVKRYFPQARLKRPRPSHVQKPKDAEERAKKN